MKITYIIKELTRLAIIALMGFLGFGHVSTLYPDLAWQGIMLLGMIPVVCAAVILAGVDEYLFQEDPDEPG